MSTIEAVPQGTIHAGWALKLGALFKTWRRRWFVLMRGELLYFTSLGTSPKGVIDLTPAVVFLDPTCKRQPAFSIRNEDRTWHIVTETRMEAVEWVNKIRCTIATGYHAVSVHDFKVLWQLGAGEYGKVFLVEYCATRELFAMKSLSKKQIIEGDLVERTLAERSVLLTANHPFLISARWAFQTTKKAVLVMEYAPGGDLLRRMRVDRKFSEPRAQIYAAQLVLGIEYLHGIGIVHRDLKPGNILIDSTGHLRITDFGFVKERMGRDSTTETFCGTPEYIAPEIVAHKPYTMMVDWWSLGIVIYEMLVGQPPFMDKNLSTLYAAITQKTIRFPDRGPSQAARDLILALCQKDPSRRLGADQGASAIKNHPFFAGVVWQDVLEKRIPMEWVPVAMPTHTDLIQDTYAAREAVEEDEVSSWAVRRIRDFSLIGVRPNLE
jgi:serine/threonine protein kinase